MNSAAGGRPRFRHRVWCDRHHPPSSSAHNRHPALRKPRRRPRAASSHAGWDALSHAGMPVAQPVSMLTELAAGDLARPQRPVSHHGRVRRRRPHPPVGAAVELPAPQMSQTESAVAARVHAAGDLAGGVPRIGSPAAGTSTSTRNSGRTDASRRPCRPVSGCVASAATLIAARPCP